MLIDLADATPCTSGGKAAPLARLLRAGLPVPPGFVVPASAYQEAISSLGSSDPVYQLVTQATLPDALVESIALELSRIAGGPWGGVVAVRSSATSEDAPAAAAAGQYDTFLAIRGPDQVAAAVRDCWASLWSSRAVQYRAQRRHQLPAGPPVMAVLVQRMVDADVAGVLFTGATTRIEASWGLGSTVVSGQVTPDFWTVTDGTVVSGTVGEKASRADRVGADILTRETPPRDRRRLCLTDDDVLHLAHLGRQVDELLGRPQDIEWAIANGATWILQARPVTAVLPSSQPPTHAIPLRGRVLAGTPGSPGRATGPARLVRGPGDFPKVRRGDVLICRTTDPAWTPLFGVAAAVVTETGGLLSHAAIVARELGLPAVLAVPHATTDIPDNVATEVDGTTGQIALTHSPTHGR